MKKTILNYFHLFYLCTITSCIAIRDNHILHLPPSHKRYNYITNYFKLSEQRKIEEWYNTYLTHCQQFYKIKNPTKDTILNLIKSYWVTSDMQHHEIIYIKQRKVKSTTEVYVTMHYSYRNLKESTTKLIPKLTLQMVLNKKNKIVSIVEFSRGI